MTCHAAVSNLAKALLKGLTCPLEAGRQSLSFFGFAVHGSLHRQCFPRASAYIIRCTVTHVHCPQRALRFTTTHLCIVALANGITLRAVTLHRLVVRSTIAATTIDDSEKTHVWHGPTEFEADSGGHLSLIHLRHKCVIVNN